MHRSLSPVAVAISLCLAAHTAWTFPVSPAPLAPPPPPVPKPAPAPKPPAKDPAPAYLPGLQIDRTLNRDLERIYREQAEREQAERNRPARHIETAPVTNRFQEDDPAIILAGKIAVEDHWKNELNRRRTEFVRDYDRVERTARDLRDTSRKMSRTDPARKQIEDAARSLQQEAERMHESHKVWVSLTKKQIKTAERETRDAARDVPEETRKEMLSRPPQPTSTR